LTYLLQA
jgi:hypothetical protein